MAFAAGSISYPRDMSTEDPYAPPVEDGTDPVAIDAFIGRWQQSGGAEMANFQTFANELCDLLGVPRPDPAQEEVERNDYVFERRVDFKHDDGSTTPGRIDLYKRHSFVMEAKQSAKRIEAKKIDPEKPELIPEDATKFKPGTATRGHWALGQGDARRQAAGGGLRPRVAEGARLAALHPRGRCRPRDRGLRRLLRPGEELRPVPGSRRLFHPAGRSARSGHPRPSARDLVRPSLPRSRPTQRRGYPRHRRAPRPHRPQPGRQARCQGGRGVPDALPLHHVRGGCRPTAQEGVRKAAGRDGEHV